MTAPARLTWGCAPPAKARRGGGRYSLSGVDWRATAAMIAARPHEYCRVEVAVTDPKRVDNAANNLRAADPCRRLEVVVRGGAIYARYGGPPGTASEESPQDLVDSHGEKGA